QITIEIALRPIEIKIPNRQPTQIPTDPRIDRLADNPVHTSERTDIDDPRRTLPRQVHHLPYIEHHLAERALSRQVRARAFQNLVDVGLFPTLEVLRERRRQNVLVMLLHALPDPRAQRLGRPDPPRQPQLPEV